MLDEAQSYIAQYRNEEEVLTRLRLRAGDPFDKLRVLGDLARISSLRADLGNVAAQLEFELNEYEDQYLTLKSEIYLDKYRAVKNGIIEGKNTDESINNLVRMDQRYIEQRRKIRTAKGHLTKVEKIAQGLFGLENALKKANDSSEGV